MDVDHGDWAVEALAMLGADADEVADAARRAADAWWALLDEREAEGRRRLRPPAVVTGTVPTGRGPGASIGIVIVRRILAVPALAVVRRPPGVAGIGLAASWAA